MNVIKPFMRKALPAAEIVLSIVWLSNLASTDAYFSIYALIAFLSFYLQIKRMENTLSGNSGFTCVVLSLALSGAVLLANYPLFTTIGDPALISRSTSVLMNIIDGILTLLGGYCVFHPIITFFLGRFPMEMKQADWAKNRKWLPYAVFAVLVFIHLLHLLLVEFPGNLTEDTFTQISEMVSGSYSNFNTYWHTMIFQSLLVAGNMLFSDVNLIIGCFVVFQVLVLCFAFTHCLFTMFDYGVPSVFLVLSFLSYAILPYHLALSITVWKDVLFAAGCLMLLSSWLRILKGLGQTPWMNYLVFILGSLLFFLSRTNGWIIYLVTFFFALLFCRGRKPFLLTMGCLALTGWVLLNPVLTCLRVSDGDIVESLSIPIQQISRVVVEGCALTDEEEEMLSRVVDLEEVPSLYTNWLSDPMKVEVRSKDYTYFQENLPEYRDLWIRLGIRYPWQYVKAWVDQTKGYWNGGYPYAMYSETIIDNPYGVEKTVSGNPAASLFRLYFGLSRHVIFFEPLHSIGLHVWLLFLCFLLNIRRKREQAVLLIPLLILVLGLWLGTPVYCCFRYVYPLFASIPLILGMSLFQKAT